MSSPFLPEARFDGLDAPHFVRYTTPDGNWVYVLTGVAMIRFQGYGQDWHRSSVEFELGLPDLPEGHGLSLVHWAVQVTPNAFANDNVASNAGWAVDRFRLRDTDLVRRVVRVVADLALRDADGFLLRLAYHVHLLGTVTPT